ncbi:MAG TPA: M50 family metallopeptidase [Longimicrobiales bacterium]|nr:M50 family metallopeptidase [Longimicrobiales bacterium]
MRKKTRRRLEFLAAFSAYFLAIWLLWPTPVIYPLKLFVVLLHEIGHGLAAIATGGSIDRIAITPDQGGVCYCMGGNALVTLSAGYLGSLAFGVAMIEAPRRGERVSAWALWFLGGLVLAIAALYVRSLFSLAVAGAAGAGLLLAAARLGHGGRTLVLTFLGLTSALYALLDIRSDVLSRPHLDSDAAMLADLTGIPTLAWGLLWIGIAGAALAWTLRRGLPQR